MENSIKKISELFHDPKKGDGASKILKTFFKSIIALVLMTGLFHDPEKESDASIIP
ncbi:MAG: hypothetical protein ACK4RM_09280 [Flavobacterium sp.]